MARKFFYVCAGMLMLALSFHFGFTTATAQAPGNPVVAAVSATTTPVGGSHIVVTANGDIFYSASGDWRNWTPLDNVFSGPPTPVLHETWGQVKSRYAPSRTAKPGATNR